MTHPLTAVHVHIFLFQLDPWSDIWFCPDLILIQIQLDPWASEIPACAVHGVRSLLLFQLHPKSYSLHYSLQVHMENVFVPEMKDIFSKM